MPKKTSLHFINEEHEHDHDVCIAEAMAKAEKVCQQRGQRFTTLRRRVFELVWVYHRPMGAYEVLELLQRDGRAAPPTVYRALDFLLEIGLVHRIASLNAYVGCIQPHQPHEGQFFICEACKSYAELDDSAINAAIADSAAAHGFSVRQHTVEVMGLCPSCQKKEEPSS